MMRDWICYRIMVTKLASSAISLRLAASVPSSTHAAEMARVILNPVAATVPMVLARPAVSMAPGYFKF